MPIALMIIQQHGNIQPLEESLSSRHVAINARVDTDQTDVGRRAQ